MTTSYRALCTDFYINQRLNLKMDLPMRRDTVLSFFDRIRRGHPWMDKFRRYRNELALESGPREAGQEWLGVRKTSVRSGSVNPDSPEDACKLHAAVLENAPFFLDISPLDVDYLELLFGFDLLAAGNHDAIVYEALIAGSSLAPLLEGSGAVLDCQPILGLTIPDGTRDGTGGDIHAHFEVKTRATSRQSRGGGGAAGPISAGGGDFREEPISIYLTVRKHGPVTDVAELPRVLMTLHRHGLSLMENRVVPHLLAPIRTAITTAGM